MADRALAGSGSGRAYAHLRTARALQDRAFGLIGGAADVRDVFGAGTLGLAAERWSAVMAYVQSRLSVSAAGAPSGSQASSGPASSGPAGSGPASSGPAGSGPASTASSGAPATGERGMARVGEIVRLAAAKFETNVYGGMLDDFREAMRDLISAEQLTAFVDEFAAADPDACVAIQRELGEAIGWSGGAGSTERRTGVPHAGPDPEAAYDIEILRRMRDLIGAHRAVITESQRSMDAILTATRQALHELHESDCGSEYEVLLAVTGSANQHTGVAAEPFRVRIGGDTVYAIWKSMDDALLRLEADALAECVAINESLGRLLPGPGGAAPESAETGSAGAGPAGAGSAGAGSAGAGSAGAGPAETESVETASAGAGSARAGELTH